MVLYFYKGVKNHYEFLTAIITVAFITCDTMLRIIHCRHRQRGGQKQLRLRKQGRKSFTCAGLIACGMGHFLPTPHHLRFMCLRRLVASSNVKME